MLSTLIDSIDDISPRSILDICCGPGISQIHGIEIDGIDINPKYIDIAKGNGYRDILCGNAVDILGGIESMSYDLCICIDGIEHFEYVDAIKVVDNMERIAAVAIIVFTPNDFNDNKHNAKMLNEPYQEHLSLLKDTFWIERGYSQIYSEFNDIENVHNNMYLKLLKVLEMRD